MAERETTANVTRVKVDLSEVGRIAHLPQVREALHSQASAIASRAKSTADRHEVAESIFTQDGTRPRGRPFSRAVSDNGDQFVGGVGKTRRRQLLAHAADITT